MTARVNIKPYRGGYVGSIAAAAPGVPGVVRVSAIGASRADALANAALLAERIASDPVMAAILPPGTANAIKAAKGLAAAAIRGPRTLRRFWGGLRGNGERRLAKALHVESSQVAEVGLLPIAVLAAKYGPSVAKRAHKLYRERKRMRADAKRARAERARASEREPEPVEPVEPEPVEPEADEGENEGES